MRVTATARRSGDWWAIEVAEVPGLFTQVRRLDQVEAMVKDAAELLGSPVTEVDVVPDLPSVTREKVSRAKASLNEAANLQKEASIRSREAAADLRGKGLTVRDVATVLGVSAQRVSQIAPSGRLKRVTKSE